MPQRYSGRPFLRLLECYVLWSIDALTPDLIASLNKMAPKLRETYNATGSWQDIVAGQMDFGPDLPGQLRQMWSVSLRTAADRQETIDPNIWAQTVVDKNFI